MFSTIQTLDIHHCSMENDFEERKPLDRKQQQILMKQVAYDLSTPPDRRSVHSFEGPTSASSTIAAILTKPTWDDVNKIYISPTPWGAMFPRLRRKPKIENLKILVRYNLP